MDQKYHTLSQILFRSRQWHAREQCRYDLHPVVLTALSKGWEPDDWHLLILEWPHESTKQAGMLSYTLNEKKGLLDRQEPAMKPGRYLRRHFSRTSDDEIRDLVSTMGTHIRIVKDVDEMVRLVQVGPYSCMKWEGRDNEFHPYRAYDPDYGWGLAVLYKDGQYEGRALVLETAGRKGFVRTFGPSRLSSETHDGMQSLLEEMGYSHWDGWPSGTKLAWVGGGSGPVFPYLDGNLDNVDLHDGYLRIVKDGEYECDCQDGTATEKDKTYCESCDEAVPEDETTDVGGPYGSRIVCEWCRDNRYEYVRGSRYGRYPRQYYVLNNDAEHVDGEAIDSNHLPDDIVRLENGDLCGENDAVEVDGEWYHYDDNQIVCTHTGDYQMADDCVELSDISNSTGFALEDDCVETQDGWILADEARPLDLSPGGWKVCHYSAITTVGIDGVTYTVHEDEDIEELTALLTVTSEVSA